MRVLSVYQIKPTINCLVHLRLVAEIQWNQLISIIMVFFVFFLHDIKKS